MRKFAVTLALLGVAGAASAAELVLDGRFVQGGMVLGRTQPPAKVTLDGRKVPVARDGSFVFGFGRDAASEALVVAAFPDGRTETRKLKIAQRKYRIQRIEGLPRRKVTPSPEDLKRIRREGKLISAARGRFTDVPWYRQGFIWPAIGPVSGVYGSQRILNGKPRRPHYGVDVAMPTGTPVRAAAAGIISLAAADMFFTGGTLIIDHGHGISSVYSHLSAIRVKQGDRVEQGQAVGAIGATGRATGAHLDWRVNWFQTRLDPALLVPPMPPPAK